MQRGRRSYQYYYTVPVLRVGQVVRCVSRAQLCVPGHPPTALLCASHHPGYSIDITLPALRIALEADGPTHTSRTPGGAMLGATAMKRRHLQRLGWQVVNVTYTVSVGEEEARRR